jgi:WD40 repeat protein
VPEPRDGAQSLAADLRSGIRPHDAAFSHDGSRVILNGHPLARLVDVSTGQPVGRPILSRWQGVGPVAFSQDGRRIAISSHDLGSRQGGSTSTVCQVFDAATGLPVSPLLPHCNWVRAMAFSPDSTMLATGDYSAVVHLWNAETGAVIGKPFFAGSIVWSVAFSPDGRLLAAGTAEPAYCAILWDLVTRQRRGDFVVLRSRVHSLAFSLDGALLAAAGRIAPVQLIDTATGRVRAVLRHGKQVRAVTFSSDGRLILTGGLSDDDAGSARLWDARSGEPASPVVRHAAAIPDWLAFNPAGTTWARAHGDGSVWLFDVATSRPIGAPRFVRNGVTGFAFAPDGRSLLVADGRGNLLTWRVPQPAAGTTEALIRRVQLRTAMDLDSGGAATFLTRGNWDRLRAEAGDPMWNAFALSEEMAQGEVPITAAPHAPATTESGFSAGATDDQAWHESNARDAEALGDSEQGFRRVCGIMRYRHPS